MSLFCLNMYHVGAMYSVKKPQSFSFRKPQTDVPTFPWYRVALMIKSLHVIHKYMHLWTYKLMNPWSCACFGSKNGPLVFIYFISVCIILLLKLGMEGLLGCLCSPQSFIITGFFICLLNNFGIFIEF